MKWTLFLYRHIWLSSESDPPSTHWSVERRNAKNSLFHCEYQIFKSVIMTAQTKAGDETVMV